MNIALKVSDLDNVATIFANGITDGTEVEVRDKKGNAEIIKVIGDVPFGHKIALRDIKKGEEIKKYGEENFKIEVDNKLMVYELKRVKSNI